MAVFTSALRSTDSFESWLERCRIAIAEPSGAAVPAELVGLAADMPRAFARWQRENAQGLLTRLLCRVATRRRPLPTALAIRVVTLLGQDFDAPWREEWAQLVTLVTQGGDSETAAAAAATADPRVARALAAIDRCALDAAFRLRDVASELGVSACRLTQLLKAETGHTFGAHVQTRRIAQACVLLSESELSIKEIAYRVGYQSTTQLDRQFKQHTSLLPSAYRRARATPRRPRFIAVTRSAPLPSRSEPARDSATAPTLASTLSLTKRQK